MWGMTVVGTRPWHMGGNVPIGIAERFGCSTTQSPIWSHWRLPFNRSGLKRFPLKIKYDGSAWPKALTQQIRVVVVLLGDVIAWHLVLGLTTTFGWRCSGCRQFHDQLFNYRDRHYHWFDRGGFGLEHQTCVRPFLLEAAYFSRLHKLSLNFQVNTFCSSLRIYLVFSLKSYQICQFHYEIDAYLNISM